MSSNLPSIDSLLGDVLQKPAQCGVPQQPTVSVVTVCLNPIKAGRLELFAKNLDSVQQQTGVTVEHVIVDGASSDGTLQFVRSYRNQHHDMCLLSRVDSGIYDAMNRGIALSRGKYVTFLNSDDFYNCPDGLARSVRALEESGCAFSFAPICPSGPRFLHRLHRHPERHLHRIFIFPTIPHQSMLYLRDTLVAVDGYDPSYRMGGDHDLTLRLIEAGCRGCFVEEAFVAFASGGFSTQDAGLKLREKMRRVRRFHKEVFGVEFSDREAETLVRRYRYPRRCLGVYVASQRMIDKVFVGVPQTLRQRLTHGFNYWKYYLKCLLGV